LSDFDASPSAIARAASLRGAVETMTAKKVARKRRKVEARMVVAVLSKEWIRRAELAGCRDLYTKSCKLLARKSGVRAAVLTHFSPASAIGHGGENEG
tara:strand:+ start:5829 stop:6122 length:294 start_codon:yes stop_codon:yes gene_type:complete